MAAECVDRGANTKIYDENGAPFCLLSLNVRDRKSRMQDAAIRDSVQSAQEEYNLSLKDLSLKAPKAAHALGNLDSGRPDGTATVRKANVRFAKAKDEYQER